MNDSNDASDVTSGERGPWKPTPDNFDAYLPWACCQLELGIELTIINVQIGQRSNTPKAKIPKHKIKPLKKLESYVQPVETKKTKAGKSKTDMHKSFSYDFNIKIYAIYKNENLVELKFDNNKTVPIELLKVIGLILQFHSHLASITINRGINKAATYELCKMLLLPSPKITDVCLDDTAVMDANYDILLQGQHLKQLSLSRCKIDDAIVYKIASKLSHPLPASKTLTILNLASNRITDTGAKYIAETLRTNRKLAYLNLAGNALTDDGSIAILDFLIEFLVTSEELITSKSMQMQYWRKHGLPPKMNKEIEAENRKTETLKKKNLTQKKTVVINKSVDVINPFSADNVIVRDGLVYCYGNNNLSYINLSYNDISYLTVKKLLTVLLNQQKLDRQPRGLINVSIEGNCIPDSCTELNEINDILDSYLAMCVTTSRNKILKSTTSERSGP